jgi:hypothetical protein
MHKLVTLGFWFSRPPTVTGWLLSRLGWQFTHVGLRVDDCVYEIRLDSRSEWLSVSNYESIYPTTTRVEWLTYLDLDEVDRMFPCGVRFQLLASIRQYLTEPIAPTAWNCLTAGRRMLEHLGKPSDAVTPDQLYAEVLDLRGSLLRDRQTGRCRNRTATEAPAAPCG